MGIPKRIERQEGRFSQVDGIPFEMPVRAAESPAFMAAFSIDADRAAKLLPGEEIHPLRIWNRGVLIVTVINYENTPIGKYIEFSIGIGCTHGSKPAPRLLPLALMKTFGTGQYVFDLPVSTEVSVKGGKGIWGMPKHQANIDFKVSDGEVSSQYDLDGKLAMYISIRRPGGFGIPLATAGSNWCAFRGMLMKSVIHFRSRMHFALGGAKAARLVIGDHPRMQPLKDLDIAPRPMFTAFFPEINGVLDDHVESWFLTNQQQAQQDMEGMESVVNLGLGEQWLAPPNAPVPQDERIVR
jgi:hypothetical protein